MGKILCLTLLLSLMGCAELITVKTPTKYVNVTTGGTVLLQCTFVTIQDTTNLNIQWEFVSSTTMKTEQVYYYQSGKDVISKDLERRLQPPSNPGTSRNASILIRNMQPSDTGVYTCNVHNLPDVDGQSQVSIVVDVLEKPSVPFCAVHGDVESGHLVTLTCHSEHGSPKPTYTWKKLDQAKVKRPVLGRTTTGGILEIRNISEFQFGEYQCTAINTVGFSICTVELSHDVGSGVIAGAVIGALLGCVLIVLIVWFILHTLKKKKYKSVKVSEDNEMKGSAPQSQDSVPTATAAGSNHAEEDEAQA